MTGPPRRFTATHDEMPWRSRGACLDVHTSVVDFHSEHPVQITAAKRICVVCPVRTDCLVHALKAPERFGVWGGMDEEERRGVRMPSQERGPQ